MADILVHNAIKDIEAAINEGQLRLTTSHHVGKNFKIVCKRHN